jgi:hypothetical protein
MRVLLPSPLFSYTGGQREVEGRGESLTELLNGLDHDFPGLRHRIVDEQGRIRRHIRFFVNGEMTDRLDHLLTPCDQVLIVAALSGG